MEAAFVDVALREREGLVSKAKPGGLFGGSRCVLQVRAIHFVSRMYSAAAERQFLPFWYSFYCFMRSAIDERGQV